MRLVYLILAHRRPDLVHTLVDTLRRHTSVGIYLHIDARADLASFIDPIADAVNVVRPRTKANWGSFGIVGGTLAGIRAIATNERGPYRFVLMSGQDHPIKPLAEIERFFATSPHSAHIEHYPMGEPPGKELTRYTRYVLHNQLTIRGKWRLEAIVNRVLPPRTFPDGYSPHSGGQWWSATDEVIAYIARFTKQNKRFVRFFWATNIPDEMFFQTVIMNSPFAQDVLSDDLRFTEWPFEAWSPRDLTHDDIPRLLDEPALFARKFSDVAVMRELQSLVTAPT